MDFKRLFLDKVTIARGSPADFSKYYEDSKYMRAGFEKLVEQETLIPFFALFGDKMIGKIYFVTKLKDLQIADGKQVGYICNLYVKKPFRNNGIGTMLVETVKRYASSNGFSTLTLGVEEDNIKNMYLYHKLGFNNKVKDMNTDLLFKDAEGKAIIVHTYAVYSCDL
ncbi:MAG: GNAT family N-acetyltransferase [Candidatus Fimenecus sp.]